MWHNRAWETIQKHSWPAHTMHYEDYSRNHSGTITELFDFLELDTVDEFIPFKSGKTYHDYFDDDYRQKVQKLSHDLAIPEVWELISRYF